MKRYVYKWIILAIIGIIAIVIVPITYSKYISTASDTITLNIRKPIYYLKYYNNGNLIDTQEFVYGTAQNIRNNTQTVQGKIFSCWNTETNGSGTDYLEGQEVNNLASVDGTEINLYAQWVDGVARIGTTYYNTLQAAISAVPNNTQTTVELLADVSEQLTVSSGKNIIFDFKNHTISATSGTLLQNSGTIVISNGILTSSSENTATINNEQGATLTITGGQVLMTNPKGKQAIYNNKGTINISGSAYLCSESNRAYANNNVRATLQNQSQGTVNITGGTIISKYFDAINNAGTMTIGTKDGNVDKTSPVIQGAGLGINSSSNFKFYDGIVKGITNPINNESRVSEVETNYRIAHGVETIDNATYSTAYLALETKTVEFNGNGGTSSEPTREVEVNNPVGVLPTATRNGYRFLGWFTLPSGGTQITGQEIVTQDVTYYAQWEANFVADINGTKYSSMQAAINSIPTNGTQTTITLLKNLSETVKTKVGQNIILDLQTYTMSNKSGSAKDPTIENHGVLEVINGNVTSNGQSAAIDNKEGTLKINGVHVTGTGGRQAVYNYGGGTIEITGSTYLSSNAAGVPTSGSSLERATLQNEAGGTIVVTSGTITCDTQHAISNEGTLTIGSKDGSIDTSTPSVTGRLYGVNNIGTVNFYDGIVKGVSGTFNSSLDDIENNSQTVAGTEVIDGLTYNTEHLELVP